MGDFSIFSREELEEIAAKALRKITESGAGKGISKALFDAIIRTVPQTCVEAIIVDNIKKPNMVLLTPRDDEHYQGWHCPGSYIRFGEDLEATLKRLIGKELGVGVKSFRDTGLKFTKVDIRGHSICLPFLADLDTEPEEGKWFTGSTLPEDVLELHKKFLSAALGWK